MPPLDFRDRSGIAAVANDATNFSRLVVVVNSEETLEFAADIIPEGQRISATYTFVLDDLEVPLDTSFGDPTLIFEVFVPSTFPAETFQSVLHSIRGCEPVYGHPPLAVFACLRGRVGLTLTFLINDGHAFHGDRMPEKITPKTRIWKNKA